MPLSQPPWQDPIGPRIDPVNRWGRWFVSLLQSVNGGAGALVQTNTFTDPNSNVVGSIGNLYTSTTDGSLWKKTSGTQTATGWTAV